MGGGYLVKKIFVHVSISLKFRRYPKLGRGWEMRKQGEEIRDERDSDTHPGLWRSGWSRRAHYRLYFDVGLGRFDISTSPRKGKETGFLKAEGISQFSSPPPMPKYLT